MSPKHNRGMQKDKNIDNPQLISWTINKASGIKKSACHKAKKINEKRTIKTKRKYLTSGENLVHGQERLINKQTMAHYLMKSGPIQGGELRGPTEMPSKRRNILYKRN